MAELLIDAVKTVYEFNRRATEQVLDAAERLTEEQWLAPQTAGRGSIRDTLVHLVGGQRIWFQTWGGTLPPEEAARKSVDPEEFKDVASVRGFFRTVDGAISSYLDGLKPEQLQEVHTRTYGNGRVQRLPLWQMLLSVTYHSMQHRSEVAAMLTAFGQSPGELGMTQYLPSVE